MLNSQDQQALTTIREFLDDLAYAYKNYRVIPGHDTLIFPDFAYLQNLLKNFNPVYRLIFTLFRQGHAAEEWVLREVFPAQVVDAMTSTGLLVKNERGYWHTPGLAIIPIEGLYLAVSLPPHYPTAPTTKQPVYLGAESIWLTHAIPPRLNNCRVLDVCAGSGIQGLICAARGAAKVVGLEKSEFAVSVARFNAGLNGFQNIVEVRQSDLFSALGAEERFDFVISNPPFMPVMEDVDYPICGTGGSDGTRILRGIYKDLAKFLADDGKGVMFCHALGGQYAITFNNEVLQRFATEEGLAVSAYVTDKSPIRDYMDRFLEGNLKNTCPEIPAELRKQKIETWRQELSERNVPAEYLYDQIIRFSKNSAAPGLRTIPVYDPRLTDPLYKRIAVAQKGA